MAGKKRTAGRNKGTTKEVTDARKTIQTEKDLSARISQDAIKAYNVIVDVMEDDKASAASRRAAAGDVLSMFSKVHRNSKEVLKEFEQKQRQDNGEDDDGSGEDDQSNVMPLFEYSE